MAAGGERRTPRRRRDPGRGRPWLVKPVRPMLSCETYVSFSEMLGNEMPRDESLDFDHLSATLYTAVVFDVLDQLGHPGHVASSELMPVLRCEHVLIGRARTARAEAVSCPP